MLILADADDRLDRLAKHSSSLDRPPAVLLGRMSVVILLRSIASPPFTRRRGTGARRTIRLLAIGRVYVALSERSGRRNDNAIAVSAAELRVSRSSLAVGTRSRYGEAADVDNRRRIPLRNWGC